MTSPMDPGKDPWLEGVEAERREQVYGQPVNPENSRSRADTFGIRPDLFQALNESVTKKATVDDLIRQARERVLDAAWFLAQSAAALEKADAALVESDKAVSVANVSRTRAEAAVSTSGQALQVSDDARKQARQAVQDSAGAVRDSADAVAEARRARSESSDAVSEAALARSTADGALSRSEDALGVAREADLTSDEGKRIAIGANTAAVGATNQAVVALTRATASNSQAVEALGRSSEAHSRAITATNKSVDALGRAVESTVVASEANSRAIRSTNQAVTALVAANEANSTAIAATNRSVVSIRNSAAANAQAIEALGKATLANTNAISLMHLNNHGAWSLSKKYTIKKDTWTDLYFGKAKGDVVGCEQDDLGNSEGSLVRFLEAGQWEVSARFYVPAKKLLTVGGGRTDIGLVHMRSGQRVDYAESNGYDDGWYYTLSIRTVFNVQKNDYMYVRARSNSNRGDGPLSDANTNDSYSELIVRQLSRG